MDPHKKGRSICRAPFEFDVSFRVFNYGFDYGLFEGGDRICFLVAVPGSHPLVHRNPRVRACL